MYRSALGSPLFHTEITEQLPNEPPTYPVVVDKRVKCVICQAITPVPKSAQEVHTAEGVVIEAMLPDEGPQCAHWTAC